MLKRRALRKILITTITVFILLVVYLIPTQDQSRPLEANLEVEYITGLGTNSIYLLNEKGYLVKTKILLTSNDIIEQVEEIIENLTDGNGAFPSLLKPVIPDNVKLFSCTMDQNIVKLDFSKEYLDIPQELEEKVLQAIVYSILDLKGVDGVKISVDGNPLTKLNKANTKLPDILTKDIGINKRYDINGRENINKVVIYYLDEYENNTYYVPVTKYVNDTRDKIKIIVDNLTSNYIYEPNLMSFLNQDTQLLNYEIIDNNMVLNFNDAIFTDESKIIEEVVYSIAYSVFDTYNVDKVLLRVNDQDIVSKTIYDN